MNVYWNVGLSLITGLLRGSTSGAVVAHWLAKRRDKGGRKKIFLGFVTHWKSRAERETPSVTANQFNSDVAALQREFALIKDDFGPDLESAIESVTERTAGQIEQPNCHKELLLNLGKIERLVERAK